MNSDEICRICLENHSNSDFINIFEGEAPISALIMTCASVQIVQGDGLPIGICLNCMHQLNAALLFKQKCEQSDLRLQAALSSSIAGENPDSEGNNAFQSDVKTRMIYVCIYCTFKTESETLLTNHMELHDPLGGTEKIKDEIRSESGSSVCFVEELEPVEDESFNCETADLTTYDCKNCNFKTPFLMMLKEHVKESHLKLERSYTLKTYFCKSCDFLSNTFIVDFKHRLLKRCSKSEYYGAIANEVVIWYNCPHCPYKTRYLQILNRHSLNKHTTNSNIEWLYCNKCTYRTKVSDAMKAHQNAVHLFLDKVRWFSCKKCPYKTKRLITFKNHHIYFHKSPDEINWFDCDQCTYKGKTWQLLRKHTIVKHLQAAEIQWFKCDQCPFKAKLKHYVRKHYRKKHGGEFQENEYSFLQRDNKKKSQSEINEVEIK